MGSAASETSTSPGAGPRQRPDRGIDIFHQDALAHLQAEAGDQVGGEAARLDAEQRPRPRYRGRAARRRNGG